MTGPDDQTLEELRFTLAEWLPGEAAFEGWSAGALDGAAGAAGVPADRARLAIPGGAIDMIDAWFAEIDRRMSAWFTPEDLAAMRVRERITALVETRLRLVAPHREALRRALAVLALPTNIPKAAALAWRAADAMWRLAGDRSVDTAYYTKRASLAAVYGSTLLVLVEDDSEDQEDSRAFLARRIDDIMRIETVKAKLRRDPERRFDLTRVLGRLRYPVR